MGRGEGDIAEKGLRAPMFSDKLNGTIGKELTGKAITSLLFLFSIFTGRIIVMQRHRVVIAHATKEDPLGIDKGTVVTRLVVVPLARPKSMIAMISQRFAQCGQRGVQGHQIVGVINAPAHDGAEGVGPRVQRRARRDTDRAAQAAHDVVGPKRDTRGREIAAACGQLAGQHKGRLARREGRSEIPLVPSSP